MSFKSDIKKAITANTKYVAVKVERKEVDEYSDGSCYMTIEITVRKKAKKRRK